MPKKNNKQVPRKKLSRTIGFILLFCMLILLVLVVLLLLNDYGIINLGLGKANKIATSISLKDECSIIAGQIIHTINNADECNLKCRSGCYTISSSYTRADFALSEKECNLCQCYCN